MAAVTIHSDFGAQENKICHCFHFYSFYLPWSDGAGYHLLITIINIIKFPVATVTKYHKHGDILFKEYKFILSQFLRPKFQN